MTNLSSIDKEIINSLKRKERGLDTEAITSLILCIKQHGVEKEVLPWLNANTRASEEDILSYIFDDLVQIEMRTETKNNRPSSLTQEQKMQTERFVKVTKEHGYRKDTAVLIMHIACCMNAQWHHYAIEQVIQDIEAGVDTPHILQWLLDMTTDYKHKKERGEV